jgi:hypothetical protein
MSDLTLLMDRIAALSADASTVTEESFRLILEGQALTATIASQLLAIRSAVEGLGIASPSVLAGAIAIGDDDLQDLTVVEGDPWKLVLAKSELAAKVSARHDEQTVLFFSLEGMIAWATTRDPFISTAQFEPDFSKPVTLRVNGLTSAFGGPELWVLPLHGDQPTFVAGSQLPETAAVNDVIHLNVDKLVKVSPRGWALTWGDLESSAAKPWRRLSCMVLAACLVQELRRSANNTDVTIRGTKRVSVSLVEGSADCSRGLLEQLIDAVQWVYAERPETRLKLVMDRLSIDINDKQSFLTGLEVHLAEALKQAQDSYAFVILERKDAYYKEMRDLMKDMKAQADLYAAKIRDLVASVTRDILGVLVLLGFSFLGKFDATNLKNLLASGELALLLKFLAGYLVLSCTLQMITHWRDAQLALAESQKWMGLLRNYTSKADSEDQFMAPIKRRRLTLWIALAISALLYAILAIAVWKLPVVVRGLL